MVKFPEKAVGCPSRSNVEIFMVARVWFAYWMTPVLLSLFMDSDTPWFTWLVATGKVICTTPSDNCFKLLLLRICTPELLSTVRSSKRMTDEMNLLGGKDIWIPFNLFVVAVKTFSNSVVSTSATLSVFIIFNTVDVVGDRWCSYCWGRLLQLSQWYPPLAVVELLSKTFSP